MGSQPRPSQVRYAYLRSDGTAYIVGGSFVAGVAAYAYQLLGGRTLGAEAFAPVSVLLTIHFLTFIVIMVPIEQLVVRRLTLDRSRSGLPTRAYWLGGLVIVGSTAFALFGVDEYLNGDRRFIAFTALTLGAHFLFAAARGHLAGWRRFKTYGMASGGASLLRLGIAVAITLTHPSASGFAVGLLLGPLVVLIWRPFRAVPVDRERLETGEGTLPERGLLTGLVLSAATSQALLLSGPIVVGLLGGSAVEISIAFAAFTLGRAPLTFGYNLLARVLPPFTEMAARGERDELRSWARGMAWASGGLATVAAALGWWLGPWIVQVAFGAEFAPGRLVAAAISFGVVFAGGGLFVGQILVARGEPARLGIAWLSGLVTAVTSLIVTPGLDAVTRISISFAVGEVVALIALVSGAVMTGQAEDRLGGRDVAYTVSKRTLDIGISLVVGILALPLILLAGLAVRIDSPGAVFFRQSRVGKNGRPFGLLKLRTMEADADEEIFAQHLARLQESHRDGSPLPIGMPDDDRVTGVGRFLRKSSIDELPNLWNVLRGHMSLVGPRPLVLVEAEMIGLDNPRFEVKPGITGLAQVAGRDRISLDERTTLDCDYVSRQSIRLDLSVLLRTVTAIFRNPGD